MYAIQLKSGAIQISPEPTGEEGEIEFDELPEGPGELIIDDGKLIRIPIPENDTPEEEPEGLVSSKAMSTLLNSFIE